MQIPFCDTYVKSSFPIRAATEADIPFVSEIMGVDATEAMGRVVTLVSPHGFFFLERITPSVYEAHMGFHPAGRGKECLHAARAGLRYAFDHLNALVVFGRIPLDDKASRMMTRHIGLRSFLNDGEREWFEIRSDDPCPL